MAIKDDAAKKALAKVADSSVKKELETAFSKQEESYAKLESKISALKITLKKLLESL